MKFSKQKAAGLIFVFCFLFLLTFTVPTSAKTVLGKKETEAYLKKTADFLIQNNPDPGYGSTGGEWAMIGLARSGYLPDEYKEKYLQNLDEKLNECDGVLHQKKYTEYSRVVIALTALGLDAADYHGYQLVRPLSEMDTVKRQGVNGTAYALIALDCGNYTIPEAKSDYKGILTTREGLIASMLESQTEEGGWNYAGSKANASADVTAMVIQALAPYYQSKDNVREAVDRGLLCLSKLQCSDGSFSDGKTENCESTAQVLTAMAAIHLDIEDERFVKSDHTVLDGLLLYNKDGGFCHLQTGNVNVMATEQALYALTAYSLNLSGEEELYEIVKENRQKTTQIQKETTKKAKKQKNLKKNRSKAKSKNQKSHKAASQLQTGQTAVLREPAQTQKTSEKGTPAAGQTVERAESSSAMITDEIQEKTENATNEITKKEDQTPDNTNIFAGLIFVGAVLAIGFVIYKKGRR